MDQWSNPGRDPSSTDRDAAGRPCPDKEPGAAPALPTRSGQEGAGQLLLEPYAAQVAAVADAVPGAGQGEG
ncbi:hypothetical protein ACWDQO_29835, partial [Streptomyces sp. NPDC003703]